jgi:hypothetical protein
MTPHDAPYNADVATPVFWTPNAQHAADDIDGPPNAFDEISTADAPGAEIAANLPFFVYEPRDKRQLIYLTKRRQCDTCVVNYNDVISACTGANSAVYLLGSSSQAAAVLF